MIESTFVLSAMVPKQVNFSDGTELSRSSFFEWVWKKFGSENGLLGIHEGTHLTHDEDEDSTTWILDSAQAPFGRDWVDDQAETKSEFYFDSLAHAEKASQEFADAICLSKIQIKEQKPEDWDAQWKATFLSSPAGVSVAPHWRVIPPWVSAPETENEISIKINPGAGFGTGTHETTQLCLKHLAVIAKKDFQSGSLTGHTTLDFGCGSGILSIGAALLGSQVDAVEIDPMALESAQENVQLNLSNKIIQFYKNLNEIPEAKKEKGYSVILANILRPVLMQFAEELTGYLKPNGILILSGLLESDLEILVPSYKKHLANVEPEIHSQGDWRAIVWKKEKVFK